MPADTKTLLGQPGPTVQDLLLAEEREVPPELKDASYVDMGLDGPSTEVYTSQAFHDLEMEHVWRRVWQVACREDELPSVGDSVLYEIGRHSIIIMRSEPEKLHAYYNVCKHRGRRLKTAGGRGQDKVACPYHGFAWNLDGSLKSVPSAWDFPHVNAKNFCLEHVQVDVWGGFVFINLDPSAPPLLDYLGDIPKIYQRWPLENRFTAAHVSKKLRCNWKVALEAFIESMHVSATHPQIAGFIGDENSQYDVWPDTPHHNRMIVPRGVASPSLGERTQDEIYQAGEGFQKTRVNATIGVLAQGDAVAAPVVPTVPSGSTARREMAARQRNRFTARDNRDLSWLTDVEAADTIQYFIFPNFTPWWSLAIPNMFFFRPLGDDPNACLMDIYLLVPVPEGGTRPAPATTTHLEFDQPFAAAKEIGPLAVIADQDSGNLGLVQQGLRDAAMTNVTLARYQESRIRHFQKILQEYITGTGAGRRAAPLRKTA